MTDPASTPAPARQSNNPPPPADPSAPAYSPDPQQQLAWLDHELDLQLSAYRHRRERDKHKAFALQLATVTLSATITVLLGLRTTGTVQQRLADIALALGAIITVLAAAEAFFTHRGLWLLRTHTVRDLETLRRHLDYYRAGLGTQAPDPATVQRYLAELDTALATDHTTWQQLRATTHTPDAIGTRPRSNRGAA